MKFKVYTLGCKVNQYDSGDLASKLQKAGYSPAGKNADLAIINTCSVTKVAIGKDKRMLNKAKQENPQAKIVLMGCFVKTYQTEAEKIPGVDLLWTVGDLDDLIEKLREMKVFKNDRWSDAQKTMIVDSDLNKSRYFLKVQDGCEQFCSYCVIPYSRGSLKSRAINEIVKEVEIACKNGYKEFILSGIHLGLYGVNTKSDGHKDKFSSLYNLLKELIKVKNLGRIRLSSIEITEVSDEIIELMAATNKICKHLHISLQSGCDKILKNMNRPYTTKYFKERIKKIRLAVPDISITTDVIVGFPGETDNDFELTYKFCQDISFSKVHVFSFSAHEKTPAYSMKNKVSKEIISQRSVRLRNLSEKLERKYRKELGERDYEVIIEKIKGNRVRAKTEFYFDLELKKIDFKDTDKIKTKKLLKTITKVS